MFGIGRRFLFPGHLLRAAEGAHEGVPGLERLTLPVPRGNVEAWFLPGDGASADAPAPMVVFAHGNGELIDDWPVDLGAYRRRGFSVLLPEYRGYGRSGGRPSQPAIVDDFARFLELAVARPDVDEHRVLFHGRSIGGGVVCALAETRAPAGLVLWSTFSSMVELVRRFGVPAFMVSDRFENLRVTRALQIPTLIVHGRHDQLIPVSHAQKLADAHGKTRLLLCDADHNDCPTPEADFWGVLDEWLPTAALGPSRSA